MPVAISLRQDKNELYITNDSVMGGLSIGDVQLINDVIIFSGDISKDNNGGFTSFFQKIPLLSSNINSIRIRVAGDGNRYQLRMKSKIMGYELGYKVEFLTTINTIETHTFNLSDFKASVKGRLIPNAPSLSSAVISHVGFLINSPVPTSFNLSIYNIEFE